MRQIPTSPFPSGGRNPVAEAVSSDNTNLYVVNQDDNTIVQFIIGNDGKLYPQNTVNTPGSSRGGRRERIEPVRRGHLPAAADLLHRGAVLGSIAVYPITAPAIAGIAGGEREPHLLAS
jgi:6-phosphogluconolactonase (cycloisomerase 2 family)